MAGGTATPSPGVSARASGSAGAFRHPFRGGLVGLVLLVLLALVADPASAPHSQQPTPMGTPSGFSLPTERNHLMESLIRFTIQVLALVMVSAGLVLAVALATGAGVGLVTIVAGGLALLCLQGIIGLFRLGRRWY